MTEPSTVALVIQRRVDADVGCSVMVAEIVDEELRPGREQHARERAATKEMERLIFMRYGGCGCTGDDEGEKCCTCRFKAALAASIAAREDSGTSSKVKMEAGGS